MSDNTRMPENPVGENDRLQEDLRALREKYERTRTALEKRSELIARTAARWISC